MLSVESDWIGALFLVVGSAGAASDEEFALRDAAARDRVGRGMAELGLLDFLACVWMMINDAR
jgi:hypothetical protein